MRLDRLGCSTHGLGGNRDPARLHGFRNIAQQIDMQQAVLQRGGGDFHMVGELEAALEGALGNAAIEEFALFAFSSSAFSPLTVSTCAGASIESSLSSKPATAMVIR